MQDTIMCGQTNKGILEPKLQRRLRNNATDTERALWQRLRARQLDGCKFRRQHPFGDYILDFVCWVGISRLTHRLDCVSKAHFPVPPITQIFSR